VHPSPAISPFATSLRTGCHSLPVVTRAFATFLPATRLSRCVECKVCHCLSAVLALGSALPTHPPERLLPSQAATTATLTRPRSEPPQHQMIASAAHSSRCRLLSTDRQNHKHTLSLSRQGGHHHCRNRRPVQPTASTRCMPSFATRRPRHDGPMQHAICRSRTRIISSSASLTLNSGDAVDTIAAKGKPWDRRSGRECCKRASAAQRTLRSTRTWHVLYSPIKSSAWQPSAVASFHCHSRHQEQHRCRGRKRLDRSCWRRYQGGQRLASSCRSIATPVEELATAAKCKSRSHPLSFRLSNFYSTAHTRASEHCRARS
jgi:hypothetical protein